MSDCKSESAPKKFCSIRAESNCDGCGTTKNYQKACEPPWKDEAYQQLLRLESGLRKPFSKRYEAHHILCVSPVTKVLVGNPDIKPAIEETKWCINHAKNMLAMPLWGHTVQWYMFTYKDRLKDLDTLPEPPFSNLPQHNIDHNSSEGYTQEINDECQRVAYAIEKSGHKLKGDALKKKLDKLSDDWRAELERRGSKRQGGTHRAFKMGFKNGAGSSWIHPFSMASDEKIGKLSFPIRTFNDKSKAWIDRLANAMSHGA